MKILNTILLFIVFVVSADLSAQLQDVQFDYQYDISVETENQKNTNLTFLLDKEEQHTAMKMNKEGMDVIVLFDSKSKNTYSLMNFNGKKMAVKSSMKPQKLVDNTEDFSDAQINDLPSKKILGFTAKGKSIKTSEETYKVYFISKPDYKFYDVFKMNSTQSLIDKVQEKTQIPKNSIMLENTVLDNKSGEIESRMICTSLKKIDEEIKASEYKVQNALIEN